MRKFKRQIKRKKVAHELAVTEKTYVDNLESLKKNFLDPLLAVVDQPGRQVLSRDSIRKIFSDVLPVILSYNMQFYFVLQTRTDRWHEDQIIGDIFIEMVRVVRDTVLMEFRWITSKCIQTM
jgi:hypothetical protein